MRLRSKALQIWKHQLQQRALARYERRHGRRPPFNAESVRSILVLLAPAVGDVVINSTYLAVLKQYFSQARLTVVWGRQVERLRALMPAVDESVIIDAAWFNNEQRRGEPWDFLSYWDDQATQSWARQASFDLVINANGLLESMLLTYAMDAPYRIGTHIGPDLDLGGWPGWKPQAADIHVGDHNMASLAYMGFTPPPALPDFESLITQLPQGLQLTSVAYQCLGTHFRLDSPTILFHPFAATSSPSKQLPIDQSRRFLKAASAEGWQVLVVGTTADRATDLSFLLTANEGVGNLIGQYSIEELASLIAQAALYVGMDTGTTHLAAALGTPTVALFGRLDARTIGPRGRVVAIVEADNNCTLSQEKSCTRLVCSHRICLQAIKTEKILAACRTMIQTPS